LSIAIIALCRKIFTTIDHKHKLIISGNKTFIKTRDITFDVLNSNLAATTSDHIIRPIRTKIAGKMLRYDICISRLIVNLLTSVGRTGKITYIANI
ncbi:hypothetical protein, partial [Mycoplasmopsis bovis]|uniref:hypothetical protein n=1 Tax=Mycoplasmopsis bovis TaxID=28903 RepID=UPI003D293799